MLKDFNFRSESGPSEKMAGDDFKLAKPPSPNIPLSGVRTADVIASLMKVKRNKRVKASTLTTYNKRLRLFERSFPYLPENPEAILDYPSGFDGESGRHRHNQQDLLNMLYGHAARRFGWLKNPLGELERPLVTLKPVKTLSLNQVRALDRTPKDLEENTALDLLVGHGWPR